jgi:hypothetical protein
MKRLACALLLALGLVSFYRPVMSFAQEMPLEKVSSGTYTILYGGQTFRVSAAVAVKITLEMISPTEIKVSLVSVTGSTGRVTIYWVEFEKYIFQGLAPVSEPWSGTLDTTEGGFIDR